MLGSKVLIAAEIGGNHNGDLDAALQMVDAAQAAECDMVKFQKRTPHLAVPEYMHQQPKETPWGPMSYLAYRERLEFGHTHYVEIDAHCKARGIPWFASAWDIPSLEFLQDFDMPYIKIPSAKNDDAGLLAAACSIGKPLIVSTGMMAWPSLDALVRFLQGQGATFALCHTVSTYPTPNEELNIRCVAAMRERYPGVPIGYSGHEVGLAPTLAAVALGACYVERHFTLDRSLWGTDQAASVEPGGMRRLVKDIRIIERSLGTGIKSVLNSEQEAMRKLKGIEVKA